MKRVPVVVVLLLIILVAPLFAENTSMNISTMTLSGRIDPKSIFEINQIIGEHPDVVSAVPLDSGDILVESEAVGVKVGDWSVFSNSIADLRLEVTYGPFEWDDSYIPYVVNNGSKVVLSGETFETLSKEGGVYSAEGPIYIKRTNAESYPPSYQYETTITFTLLPN